MRHFLVRVPSPADRLSFDMIRVCARRFGTKFTAVKCWGKNVIIGVQEAGATSRRVALEAFGSI